ncbi:MAG: efflux RND transporter periplasmic adaptor subunit [Vicinamibacterales bacterium]
MQWLARHRGALIAAAALGALAAVALWPSSVDVDVATAARRPLTVTIDEEGETRVHHRYVVSAPLAGRVERIDLEPGDVVEKDRTVLARLRPEASQLLDARSRADATAALAAARAALGRARAEEERAKTAQALAAREVARERQLAEAGLTTRQALDAREASAVTADEALNAARFAAASAAAEVARAETRLRPTTAARGGGLVEVRAPVDGVVLRRFLDSESVVAPGARLLEIGDPSHVEVVADLLSTDAVKVKPGMPVQLEQWGGDGALAARVERVEPSGFTKVSALGVDEQRVNVIIDVDDDRALWEAMGDGFRVEVRIAIWHADDVLTVPASALVRDGDGWAVFRVDGNRARRTPVQVGHRSPREVEITGGLAAGAAVVLHPPDTLEDGGRVATP